MTVALCVALCLLTPVTGSAIKRVTEAVSCGGTSSSSATFRSHDTIGQPVIGETAEGPGIKLRDGFWVTLPFIAAPVEGAFYGTLTVEGTPIIRWTIDSLHDIVGFNVYRATSVDGPYELLNEYPLPAQSPGSYEDTTVWPETVFWYELRALLTDGTEDSVVGGPVMLETSGTLALALRPASPNPFNSETTLCFDVPNHVGAVRLVVYNVHGQVVRTLVDEAVNRGRYELVWDGRDDAGSAAAAGVYFARLQAGERHENQKVMLLR